MSIANHLSRRERQIMDILFELNEASAKQVQQHIPEAPSYSAIRAMLVKLETKGFIAHREQDLKYIYYPAVDQEEARESAIQRLLKTFFDGSASQAMSAMLAISKDKVSTKELDQLNALIKQAKKEKEDSGD